MRANDAVAFLRRVFSGATTVMVARHLGVREETALAILRMLRDEGKVRQSSDGRHYGWWVAVHQEDRRKNWWGKEF